MPREIENVIILPADYDGKTDFFSGFFRGKHIYEEQFLYKELEQVPINL